jgi:hypothetical protein
MSTMQKAKQHLARQGRLEPARVDTPLVRPNFLRLPRAGSKCPITGLSRTAMYALCKSGAVKSVVLRQLGARRGTRLVSYESLVGYLHHLEAEQNTNESPTESLRSMKRAGQRAEQEKPRHPETTGLELK